MVQTPLIYESGSACLINRKTLAPLLNDHADISPEMTVRLSKAPSNKKPPASAAAASGNQFV
jgi:hypothetical protein